MSSTESNRRQSNRTKAVLALRIKGKDSSGKGFEELAHTLDLTAKGMRLGSIRRELSTKDEVTIVLRQRRMQFRVVWTKRMKGGSEFQLGLQALTPERDVWGLNFAGPAKQPAQAFSAPPLSVLA